MAEPLVAICQPYLLPNGQHIYYLHIDKESLGRQRKEMASIATINEDAYQTIICQKRYDEIMRARGSLRITSQPKRADLY